MEGFVWQQHELRQGQRLQLEGRDEKQVGYGCLAAEHGDELKYGHVEAVRQGIEDEDLVDAGICRHVGGCLGCCRWLVGVDFGEVRSGARVVPGWDPVDGISGGLHLCRGEREAGVVH